MRALTAPAGQQRGARYLAVYGRRRAAETLVRTAVSARFMKDVLADRMPRVTGNITRCGRSARLRVSGSG
jgi:hypothetical protein